MDIELIVLGVSAFFYGVVKTNNKIKYLIQKKKLKKKLNKAILQNDKKLIKKYIIKLKDFDKKYQKNKLEKILEKIIRNNQNINEDNLFSLMNNFDFIDVIYNNEVLDNDENFNETIDEKLKFLEKKRKEILIRQNNMKQQIFLKNEKMKNNKKRGKLG